MGVAATHLTSARNPLLKDVRKAVARGGLTTEGLLVAESFHLLEEALRSQCDVQLVIASEAVRHTVENRVRGLRNIPVVSLPDLLFQEISATESTQGVMALVRPRAWDMAHVLRGQSLVAVLDGLQDPGNAGAILRAAEAFGATGALLLKGTVSPFNPKAVRASAGSIFRLPFVNSVEHEIAIAALKQHRVDILLAAADGESPLTDVDLRRRCALVIGSEGHGVSAAVREVARGVCIPVSGVESLNAAMSAGILLYEARRQRQALP